MDEKSGPEESEKIGVNLSISSTEDDLSPFFFRCERPHLIMRHWENQ